MSDDSDRPHRLEHSHCPVAIVHEGFFVYANPVFLGRLGYRTLEELAAVPLLDLVEERDHERLREHLDAAKKTAGTDKAHPAARLAFRRADDLPLAAGCTSHRTRYAGEDCVQLNLQVAGDAGLSERVRALPWRHYLSLLFLVLFTVLPSSTLLKLNIDNAPAVYFPDDEPAVVLDRQLRERFPNDQVFVLLFEGVALYSDGFLRAYAELGDRLEQMETVDKVVSVTEQDHIAGTESDFIVERLIDVGQLDDYRPAERQQRAVDDRFSGGALSALDGTALALIVVPREADNSMQRLALEEQILAAVDAVRLSGYLSAIAGQIPVDVAQLRSMLRDNMIFIPATVAIGLALVWWLFRRWLAVVLAGIAIGVVVNSTVAIYVLSNQPFTLISSIIPPLLSALTVAALVHLFNALYLASQRGYSGTERVTRAVANVDRPALFAALTTAGGLASLATSPIVPIKVFGLISALGTLLIYVVVFRVLPNVVARWDRRPWPTVHGATGLVDGVVRGLYRTGLRHPAAVITATAVVLAIGVPQIQKVVVETNLQEFFHDDHKVRQDTRRIGDVLVGTMNVAVTFDSTTPGGLKQPTALGLIRDFQQWAEQQPEIDRSIGLVDFVEEMHWAFHAEDPAYRTLPSDERVIGQYLLIYDGLDIYDFVDRDLQHSQVALSLNVHSANDISAVLERIRAYLSEQVADRLAWEIAGNGRLFADMEELLVNGQVYSLIGAIALILLFMLVLLRSLSAAMLCMIPNLSPILLIFIVMGALGIWLDMATAMIASVAVGIAVDDTIHVYHGFKHRHDRGTPVALALARTYREAGRAVVVTTLILSAQFLILVWSDFVPTANFGLLTTVGLIAALLFDLILLPALLIVIYGRNSPLRIRLARLRPATDPVPVAAVEDPPFDAAYWTAERRIALVKEILSGNTSGGAAARDFGLPEEEIERWLALADSAIAEAFADTDPHGTRNPAKVRALARAYKRLKAENRALKARQPT